MLIEVWSDVICPYCYLGHAQLEAALQQFAHSDQVTVIPRAFELDSTTGRDGKLSARDLVASKYGLPLEQVDQNHQRLGHSAKELGLPWNIDDARPTNTFDAHRLIELARESGREIEATQRLHQAYFVEGALVSDLDTLVEIAREMQLIQPDRLRDPVAGAEQVRTDEERARTLGIRGVPAFVFNDRYVLSGAQGVPALLSAIEQVYALPED
ncbi:MAG: DsbA family oxidoreductase [Acidimicrobiaceae bacterium]|nr:DsbA family oxidoreductase [Acidimicrobiaceae bacterium]